MSRHRLATNRARLAWLLPTFWLTACQPAQSPASLVAEAERSGFRRTGRYEEATQLCQNFERAYPGRAKCLQFGTTPEGRPLVAIAASTNGVLSPEAARAKNRPVIFLQGGIHAGEIDGKDGGFWALRELLDDKIVPGALDAVTCVFIPVLNADGHERFGPNHRPNQRGPEEMGFRTTAQNLNLNRDYIKVEAPEIQAVLALFEAWDPTVYVDMHTTDGAKFEHDVAVLVAPSQPQPGDLHTTGKAISNAMQTRLKAKGHLPLDIYPAFRKQDDPTSGFTGAWAPPRFSQNYAAARNRIGILIETHSWRPHDQRVRSVHDIWIGLFDQARTDAASWRKAEEAADTAGARLAGTTVALSYRPTEASRPIEFRGYAYERTPSEISGGTRIVFDETRPQIWRVPLFDTFEPDLSVEAPRAGFVIPAAFAGWVSAKLRIHGLRFETLKTARKAFPVSVFRADEVKFGGGDYRMTTSFEGRTPIAIKGAWHAESRDLLEGALFVPMAQPRALVLLHLLEPQDPESLVSWGFFNSAFEQKEYMEDYVAEEEARKMLASNPALKAEFDARLQDAAFAGNPKARLEFFYRRHPSWDQRVNQVPIYRVATSPMEK